MAALATRPVGLRARIRSCRLPCAFQAQKTTLRGGDAVQRSFGLDIHLDFCEAAVYENGRVSALGRFASTPEAIREFAASLTASDQIALEASCGAVAIARLLRES